MLHRLGFYILQYKSLDREELERYYIFNLRFAVIEDSSTASGF